MAELSDVQLDALREMGNIGAGNAATSLSQLISESINISVPAVKMVALDQVSYHLGGPERQVYVVYLDVTKDIEGTMLTLFSQSSAEFLARKLLGEESVDINSDFARSALKEVGSILCGSYLSALTQIIAKNAVASVPAMACDMLGAMLDFILVEIGQVADEIILIDVEMYIGKTHLECSQLFLPKPDSLLKILALLGI